MDWLALLFNMRGTHQLRSVFEEGVLAHQRPGISNGPGVAWNSGWDARRTRACEDLERKEKQAIDLRQLIIDWSTAFQAAYIAPKEIRELERRTREMLEDALL